MSILRAHLLDSVQPAINPSLRQHHLQMAFPPTHAGYATAPHDKLWDKSLWSSLDNATSKAR